MANVSASHVSLVETLDRLAGFDGERFPVVSLYLDARPDSRGRRLYQPFVRKELPARIRTYPAHSPERESLERDAEKIETYLADQVRRSANGLAFFACAGKDFFEALALDAPFEENRLTVSSRPHLYPLARLIDEHPRYAVVVADTRSARIFVFGRGRRLNEETLESPNVARTSVGGWSQMRYQRHVDKLHKDHARELVQRLARVVAQDRVEHILIAGDEVILPLVKEELPKELSEKVVDTLRLEKHSSEAKILEAATESLRGHEAKTDVEKVARLMDESRAGGLAVAGVEPTRNALEMGEVDEVLLSGKLDRPSQAEGASSTRPTAAESFADEFVALARRTSAKVTIVEDSPSLESVGGVGALLRYRIAPVARNFPGQEKTTPQERSRLEEQT